MQEHVAFCSWSKTCMDFKFRKVNKISTLISNFKDSPKGCLMAQLPLGETKSMMPPQK